MRLRFYWGGGNALIDSDALRIMPQVTFTATNSDKTIIVNY